MRLLGRIGLAAGLTLSMAACSFEPEDGLSGPESVFGDLAVYGEETQLPQHIKCEAEHLNDDKVRFKVVDTTDNHTFLFTPDMNSDDRFTNLHNWTHISSSFKDVTVSINTVNDISICTLTNQKTMTTVIAGHAPEVDLDFTFPEQVKRRHLALGE